MSYAGGVSYITYRENRRQRGDEENRTNVPDSVNQLQVVKRAVLAIQSPRRRNANQPTSPVKHIINLLGVSGLDLVEAAANVVERAQVQLEQVLAGQGGDGDAGDLLDGVLLDEAVGDVRVDAHGAANLLDAGAELERLVAHGALDQGRAVDDVHFLAEDGDCADGELCAFTTCRKIWC